MILAAAVCPHPPALVPAVAAGAASELAGLLAACDDAVTALLAASPDRVVVLGTGDLDGSRDESAGGTLGPLGVDVRAGGPELVLPLGLTIGAWLLDRAGWTGPRTYTTTRPDVADRVALLVMADGSARRTVAAPGFLDDRAVPFDDGVEAALRSGDARALAGLDPALGAELDAAGVPALRLLGALLEGADIDVDRVDATAPFGVAYWVARWRVRPA